MNISRSIIIFIIFVCLVSNCKPEYHLNKSRTHSFIKYVEFCSLDTTPVNTLIRTIANYTGMDEYWELTSHTGCILDFKVNLNTDEIYQSNNKVKRKFTKLHHNDSKYFLRLEIVGVLEKAETELGFGHLGLLGWQILPYDIKIISKQKL